MINPHKQSQVEQISHLPGDVLLSLARNESATREMRKAAVKLMLDKGFPQYKHPELVLLVLELRKEGEAEVEVESIVESAIEAEIPHNGALKAGFTTANMFQDEVVRNPDKLSDDAIVDSYVGMPSVEVAPLAKSEAD